MIPPGFIHDLLARADIVEIVGRHVQLKKAGINHKGLCPFHGEKSPSFIVSPSRQTYHCFGCGAHGNAVGFLMEHAGMSFPDAVRELAQTVGMTVPEDDSSPAERERAAAQKQRQATLTDVLARACDHYRRELRGNPRAIDYLKRRGLSGEIAGRFGLGYAPDGWRSLASVFPRYDDPLLEECGLVIAKPADDGSDADTRRYDRFRDRIMFPIRSVQGEVIGFGGRIIDQGEPKYLNSPETPVFSKGRELYGLYEGRAAIRQRGYVLVVEGYMDVVALAQSGFGNAVATLGTACTAEHVQKLFRFTDSVVFSFDGDAAGRRAAGRALEASLPHATDTRTVRFLFLPPEHDPDSYVRELGAEAFEACIAQAVPLSRQLVEAAGEGCDLATAEGRARLIAQARPMVEQLPDGVLRAQIVDALADAAQMARGDLRRQWSAGTAPPGHGGAEKYSGSAWRSSERPSARSGPPMPRAGGRRPLAPMASSLDRAVWLLIQRSDLWEQLDHEAHDLLSSQDAPYGSFFAWLDRLVHDQGALSARALADELAAPEQNDEFRALARRVAQFHELPVGDEARHELGVIVDRLRLQAVQVELELLVGTDGLSDAARARHAELLEQQRQIKARLARPLAVPP
ncbi:DNA primase [uncultured Piscinibacter sp.]|mgnify:CR=1 FL=1|uniref:DNA primase n=1 Tax=uncultured Piscinibacter sp. TaxID=1131835 RepID=UPI00260F866B|nr:DNA primase [uncultured Piscinibacter sp.]